MEPTYHYDRLLPCVYKFTGKERDTETGLDYFGSRYDASSLGRFMTPDKPFNDQSAGDPQSWNLYSYVRNNPLRFNDPTGDACVQGTDGNWQDDNSGGESCAQVDVNNATTAAATTVRATDDDIPYQLALGVANNITTANLSEVAVNGTLYAEGARAAWELGGLGVSWAAGRTAGGELIRGAFGTVSRSTLEAAAKGGGETVRVVCTLDGAPARGLELSGVIHTSSVRAQGYGLDRYLLIGPGNEERQLQTSVESCSEEKCILGIRYFSTPSKTTVFFVGSASEMKGRPMPSLEDRDGWGRAD
jgi:RHS repeat-associated protein